VQVAIEDYTDGLTRKALILVSIGLSYAAAATGLYALARIAL
jgi:succinate dehydrogenase / fumarate reductase membrane anchor subunit